MEHGVFVIDDAARAGFVGARGGGGEDESDDVVVARVERATSCEGDASVVMIRGTPKHGFDFELKLAWSASFVRARGGDDDDGDGDEDEVVKVNGVVVVPEASRDGADDEECYFEVKVEDGKVEHKDKEDMCVKVLKARGEAFLVKMLKTLDAELRERARA